MGCFLFWVFKEGWKGGGFGQPKLGLSQLCPEGKRNFTSCTLQDVAISLQWGITNSRLEGSHCYGCLLLGSKYSRMATSREQVK